MVGQGILDEAIVSRPSGKSPIGYKFESDKLQSCLRLMSPIHESQRKAGRAGAGAVEHIESDRDKLLKAKLRRELALGRLKELQVAEMEGRLIDASKVKDAAFSTARRVRDALFTVCDRVSAILAAQNDEIEVRRILNAEIRIALEELSKDDD